jgi:GWxTD domain-containing protein
MRFLNILGLMVFIFLISCKATHKIVQKQDQSVIYKPGKVALHPEYLVFHLNDTASQLLVKLITDELLFNQANPENQMQAAIKISYQLIDITTDPNNKAIDDSTTLFRTIDKSATKRINITTLIIKARLGKEYLLKVSIADVLHNISQQNFVYVHKQSKYSAQNYKLLYRINDAPVFRSYILPDEVVRVMTNRPDARKIYIRYQKDNTPLPPPPFSVQVEPKFLFKTDSIWSYNYSKQQGFIFPYKGFYLIQTDTSQNDGLFIANYGRAFPKVKEAPPMIPPLEYITTSEEFRNLQKGDNKKLTVDNYWLNMTSNVELARQLIRIYYSRLYYANLFFTSYKEGWKTDRGMIYIIFGPPSFITKTNSSEIWEYHDKRKVKIFSINFSKLSTTYSDNHFIMQRNDSYTPYWRNAVDSWHNGKVYNPED